MTRSKQLIRDTDSSECHQSDYQVLTLGLTTRERAELIKLSFSIYAYSNDPKNKTKMQLFTTDIFEDILGIPYVTAFINFKALKIHQTRALYEFFNEMEESKPTDGHEDLHWRNIYGLNIIEFPDLKTPKCIKKLSAIVGNEENLRLILLNEFKDNEGIKQYNPISARVYRTLMIHKSLLEGNIVTLSKVNDWYKIDPIKERQFKNDIQTIRYIEGEDKIVYVKGLKGYKYIKGNAHE